MRIQKNYSTIEKQILTLIFPIINTQIYPFIYTIFLTLTLFTLKCLIGTRYLCCCFCVVTRGNKPVLVQHCILPFVCGSQIQWVYSKDQASLINCYFNLILNFFEILSEAFLVHFCSVSIDSAARLFTPLLSCCLSRLWGAQRGITTV